MASKRKVILTVAQTGNFQGKAQNPNLPEQPNEIIQSAYECYNAGASIVHIHARDKAGIRATILKSLRRSHRYTRQVLHHHAELHGTRHKARFRGR